MREIFVSELVKDVLGPRKGINERMLKNPLGEYMTGILRPYQASADNTPETNDGHIGGGRSYEDDNDQGDIIYTGFSPTLDPKSMSHSMGLSFTSKTSEKISFNVCITWAKYFEFTENEKKLYERNPQYAICKIIMDHQQAKFRQFFDGKGKPVRQGDKDAEVMLDAVARKESDRYIVSIYLVNCIKVPKNEYGERRAGISDHIFQPQIRVVCMDGTSIEEMSVTNIKTEEETMTEEFLYREKRFYARGHMTSAVWKDIDPQQHYDSVSELDSPDTAKEIPFAWIDGKQLGDDERKIFEMSDVRTEYIPLYSIPSPEWKWNEVDGKKPSLSPLELSESWEPEKLEVLLQPLYEGYEKWIDKIAGDTSFAGTKYEEVLKRIVNECRTVLQRIGDSIKMLCNPAYRDAALAFCFANKAIAVQYKWKVGKEMTYRPFQLGFILMSLESITKSDSKNRNVCDLIWVPTGGGKTEAYLVLVAFVIAYRRRLALSASPARTGAGTAVLTRYTLRLLTIQQFRRTVSVVTAAEYLRVFVNPDSTVGWRPSSFPDRKDFVWGSSQFSTGLWIGRGATPNKMAGKEDTWGLTSDGAIERLKKVTTSGSEPAQILECPCCSTMLSVPNKGLPKGDTRISLVVESNDGQDISAHVKTFTSLTKDQTGGMVISEASSFRHDNGKFFTISLKIRLEGLKNSDTKKINAKDVDGLWDKLSMSLEQSSIDVTLSPFRASRPGYFARFYITGTANKPGPKYDFDFEIFCPNPECELRKPWFAGTPMGCIHNKLGNDHKRNLTDEFGHRKLTDGNKLVDIQDPFQTGTDFVSDRIPILALTVDDQIYFRVPSVIVSTVDKFARPAFEPMSTSIFGNVDRYSGIHGYYSSSSEQSGLRMEKTYGATTEMLEPPELILQDELHLIEGPLGSMVGFYETAIDYLCNQSERTTKILASTATIKKASEHVRSIFTRSVQVFPPNGITVDDRFFVSESEAHALDDKNAGKLYLGIIAPGKGPLTPLVRISARLAQTASDVVNDKSVFSDAVKKLPKSEFDSLVDPFWTQTTYFNAVRELAGGLALYRQDIGERIDQLSKTTGNKRDLKDPIELSGRTSSTDLPSYMDQLGIGYPSDESPDTLCTTSMFGTGVDIPRLGLMTINGQTKTTSSYIQSSGRVGRTKAGLVVALLRSSRPRDLSHYEFFIKFHRQLHRFVEVPSVYPFASGVVDRAVGPVCVTMLRHGRKTSDLMPKKSPPLMENRRLDQDVAILADVMKKREASQPDTRKMPAGASMAERIETKTDSALDNWQYISQNAADLIYVQYETDQNKLKPVVLGDDVHQSEDRVSVVFRNAPQSLRDLESETSFETSFAKTQQVKPSQFIYTYGPGSILEGTDGPRIVLSSGFGLFHRNSQFVNRIDIYKLNDERMSKSLLDSNNIYRLPTDAEEELRHGDAIYLTNPFPVWNLCINEGRHGKHKGDYILYEGKKCPVCQDDWSGGGKEAIRFVRACKRGHLDEVSWDYIVHGEYKNHTKYYIYKPGNGTIRDIKIQCPACDKPEAEFGKAYYTSSPCSSRFPERESHKGKAYRRYGKCNEGMKIIQRRASNLRIPNIRTLLSIKTSVSRLHILFQKTEIKSSLMTLKIVDSLPQDMASLEKILSGWVKDDQITEATADEIRKYEWVQIRPVIDDVTVPVRAQSYAEILLDEFKELMKGSNDGVPEQKGGKNEVYFEMKTQLNKTIDSKNSKEFFRVCPVTKLSTVSVQTGYSRQPDMQDTQNQQATPPVDYKDDPNDRFTDAKKNSVTWYPGVMNHGEGLFIRLHKDDGWQEDLDSDTCDEWRKSHAHGKNYTEFLFRDQGSYDELHPVFVWWHTLSHLLIRAIGEDAGFSSASVKERVYFEKDEKGRVRGGILLYATQAGADGSMGGLLALAPYFERMLEIALDQLVICSGDPLCIEEKFNEGNLNGACCFGCTMNSETSCEYRNMWLDRHVLLENMP